QCCSPGLRLLSKGTSEEVVEAIVRAKKSACVVLRHRSFSVQQSSFILVTVYSKLNGTSDFGKLMVELKAEKKTLLTLRAIQS
ncbi:hypothetical protein M514_03819, partial [Trichuris suis]